MESIYLNCVLDPIGERQVVKIIVCLRLSILQLKCYFPVLSLEVLVPLLNNGFSFCCSVYEGLNFTQLLEGRGILLLELSQILLKDGMILLEYDMLGSQARKLLRDLGKFCFNSVSSH